MSCACVSFDFVSSGSIQLSGSALTSDSIIRGGVTASGSAVVDVGTQVFDSFEAVYHLHEAGNGTSDEFEDSTVHQLHGTGAGSIPVLVSSGPLFCSSQQFDSLAWITLPQDSIGSSQSFTVSAMLRLEEKYKPRVWYSRGFDSPFGKWVFSLTNGWGNHITARIQTSEGTFEAFSGSMLALNRWYHFAAIYNPASGLQVYVDGVAGQLQEVIGEPLQVTNGGYIGRFNSGSMAVGRLTELRLSPEVRSQAWLDAEHAVYCGNLVEVGDEELI